MPVTGTLRDGNDCSSELRNFLREVPSDHLFKYAAFCLESSFDGSGLVLQDVINELGRRLDFDVENGRYRGTQSAIGFDGTWRAKDGLEFIVEVKTTDLYTIDLEKVAAYKTGLAKQGKVSEACSLLLIVGRSDTGAIEAQVRGSRFAWDIRIISVDGLAKLVSLKEKSNSDAIVRQIRELLRPIEFTKVDRIIDVLFATAADIEQRDEETAGGQEGRALEDAKGQTPRELLDRKRQMIVDAFSMEESPLIRHRRKLFWTEDKATRICVALSKPYEGDANAYWYALHPDQLNFLKDAAKGFLVLGCMDRDEAYAIAFVEIHRLLSKLNVTEHPNRSYWHIALARERDGLSVNLSKVGERLPLKPYALMLNDPLAKRVAVVQD